MGGRKKFGSHLFLVIGIAVIFGLSSTRCGEKSSQTGKTEETGKTEGECPVWFKDADKDGYTDGTTKVSCENPSDEYVSSAKLGDCNDNDPNINPRKTEICDGKDNNCNGQIDEGFNLGQSCSVGVGECARTGQFVCKADGSGTECNTTPGAPTLEVCDGKDNDCDGQTDEGNVCGIAGAKVSAGGYHTCAIKQDGSLWCWGDNDSGQLGDGTYSDKATPVQIMSSGVSSVALGDLHTCAIKTDGSLWCWGYNWYGQLGDGTNTSRNTPVQITSGVSSVALGGYHTCAVKTDGSLWCWGNNSSGQLGDRSVRRNTPVYIMNLDSGGGGAPSIRDESSFGNRDQKQANMEQKQIRYGCSSANIVFYIIYLIFSAFILFALCKRGFVRN